MMKTRPPCPMSGANLFNLKEAELKLYRDPETRKRRLKCPYCKRDLAVSMAGFSIPYGCIPQHKLPRS